MNRILASLLVLGVTSGVHAADKPNVLLICVDDLKPLLGCYGDKAETAEYELYDYEADPEETKNRVREQPEVVARLRALLARHPEAQPQLRSGTDPKKSDPRR